MTITAEALKTAVLGATRNGETNWTDAGVRLFRETSVMVPADLIDGAVDQTLSEADWDQAASFIRRELKKAES